MLSVTSAPTVNKLVSKFPRSEAGNSLGLFFFFYASAALLEPAPSVCGPGAEAKPGRR